MLETEFPALIYGRKKKMESVDGKVRVVTDRGWFIGPDGKGLDVGEVYCTASQNEAEQERFARLFAAAPKLLAALRAVLDCIEVIEGFITEAMDEARTALAEAEPA